MITIEHPVALIAVFLWIGFVCAISFMEAWLKFRAPGITLSLGLGIGRVVFRALNKVEWVFAIVAALDLFSGGAESIVRWQNLLHFSPVVVLIIQTLWLLPALDSRAEKHIRGEDTPPSHLHFYYVGLEFAKVASLGIFGITLLNITPA